MLVQHHGQRFDRQWAAEQVALERLAAVLFEELVLRAGFHTLGDHRETEGFAQCQDGSGDGGVIAVVQGIAHEGLVDLDLVQRQAFQIGQRGIAGAEVIQRETHAVGL